MLMVQAGVAQAGAIAWGALGVAAAVLGQSPAVVVPCFVLAGLVQLVAIGMMGGARTRRTAHGGI